ncbi:hypothetical protein OHB24_41585 [Kribbella sp. NBC_00482]|uniref:hypothetical protein n=1 Tax=Kribbella sp. NBC_00482 TaxID=2975968 RepID=UPI002E191079
MEFVEEVVDAGSVVLGDLIWGFAGHQAPGGSGEDRGVAGDQERGAGLRVVGVVAGVNVLRGLPKNRTTIGAALTDTATEVTSGAGIAITGTILATMFTGPITTPNWTTHQTTQFHQATTTAGLTLTALAAALVAYGIVRSRN